MANATSAPTVTEGRTSSPSATAGRTSALTASAGAATTIYDEGQAYDAALRYAGRHGASSAPTVED